MKLINQAAEILDALGLPERFTNERCSLTLLALTGMKRSSKWNAASRSGLLTVRQIMDHMRDEFGKDYKPNTRESIRKETLHQFTAAGIALLNPDEPDRPTNSGKTCYQISAEALTVISAFGLPSFADAARAFRDGNPLAKVYSATREALSVPIQLPSGVQLVLSPGAHNDLQRDILEKFAPAFAPGAELLYIGDTANKDLFGNALKSTLGIAADDHGKLPDVVLYCHKRKWIYLVEAVSSHGPMSPTRLLGLRERFRTHQSQLIFVSAFPDRKTFRVYLAEIAWDTEVWIATEPDHLIHFNGDRFLGPRPS
jgi:hypothetical protein